MNIDEELAKARAEVNRLETAKNFHDNLLKIEEIDAKYVGQFIEYQGGLYFVRGKSLDGKVYPVFLMDKQRYWILPICETTLHINHFSSKRIKLVSKSAVNRQLDEARKIIQEQNERLNIIQTAAWTVSISKK